MKQLKHNILKINKSCFSGELNLEIKNLIIKNKNLQEKKSFYIYNNKKLNY